MSHPAEQSHPPGQLFSSGITLGGLLLNLGSAVAFYAATVLVHLGSERGNASPEFYAFVRYAIGLGVFASVLLLRRPTGEKPPMRFILLRSLFNVAAVICFYRSVALGETGTANVLNMTYPVFVALLAWPLLRERSPTSTYILAGLCGLGIALHVGARLGAPRFGVAEIWGLASGALAALAIISLRGAALVASTEFILVWMFGFGTLVLLPLTYGEWGRLETQLWPYILGSALLGVAGQYLLTSSYRKISATVGSIVSSARIPLALVAGLLFLTEPFSVLAWLGAALIFLTNLLLALLGNRQQRAGRGS